MPVNNARYFHKLLPPHPLTKGTNPGDPPTPKQQKILDFMREFVVANGAPPTIREIAGAFQFSSPNGVLCHLKGLQKRGLVNQMGRGRSRGWVVTATLGKCPACGQEITADPEPSRPPERSSASSRKAGVP